jgi:hypothetical protein
LLVIGLVPRAPTVLYSEMVDARYIHDNSIKMSIRIVKRRRTIADKFSFIGVGIGLPSIGIGIILQIGIGIGIVFIILLGNSFPWLIVVVFLSWTRLSFMSCINSDTTLPQPGRFKVCKIPTFYPMKWMLTMRISTASVA